MSISTDIFRLLLKPWDPLPTHVHLCTDIRCTEHKNVIDQFHDDIINCLLIAAKDSIPFTPPYTFQSKSHSITLSHYFNHYREIIERQPVRPLRQHLIHIPRF